MNAADVKDVNGGFFLLSLTNTNGKITAGGQLDSNALTSGLPLPGGGGGPVSRVVAEQAAPVTCFHLLPVS